MKKETVNSLEKINVVGDRVLVKPRKESGRTDSGLYLPPGVREKEKIQYGYVVKSGPGYPIPLPIDNDEPWKKEDEKIKYVPLQVKEGDLAVFLQAGAYEVLYQGDKYFIVSQSSILMIERDEDLFN
jgi:chaperonin GroES|tara:strand:+ start:3838 stop:4218 length:381 start_codon:yes stop_codon:yes gene_type:complete